MQALIVSPKYRFLFLGMVILLSPQASWSHGGLPYTRSIFLEDNQLVGGATNYGLVFFDGKDGKWSTENSIGSEPRFYHRLANGSVITAGFMGVFISDDLGCSWRELPKFKELSVSAIAEDPENKSVLVMTTTTGGANNGVFLSQDMGEHWNRIGDLHSGVLLGTVVPSLQTGTLWVSGKQEQTLLPILYRISVADGVWEELPVDLSPYKEFRLLGIHDDGKRIMIGAKETGGRGILLGSDDELKSLKEIGSFNSQIPTSVVSQKSRWFVTTEDENKSVDLWRSTDDTQFERIPGPGFCLKVAKDATLWGCGGLTNGGHFMRSADGDSWKVMQPFSTMCSITCPAASAGSKFNPPATTEMLQFGVGTQCDATGSGTDEEASGGCTALNPFLGIVGLNLFLAYALFRRRKRFIE